MLFLTENSKRIEEDKSLRTILHLQRKEAKRRILLMTKIFDYEQKKTTVGQTRNDSDSEEGYEICLLSDSFSLNL